MKMIEVAEAIENNVWLYADDYDREQLSEDAIHTIMCECAMCFLKRIAMGENANTAMSTVNHLAHALVKSYAYD